MASCSSHTTHKKRKHTEYDGEVTKDEEVWLSDGNIVVVCRNTAFRVHKSILARHSEVFRDLFTLPEAGVDEYMDGCPVVHLSSDDPNDIRHLFLVVCCGKNYYYEKDAMLPVPFNILASLIRTSHKYAISTVLDDALGRLQKYFPTKMDAWLDKEARNRYVIQSKLYDPFTAVCLARLTDTQSILPTAYLACMEYTSTLILSTSNLLDLDPLDFANILDGATYMVHFATARLLALATAAPATGCMSPDECALTAHRRLTEVRQVALDKISVWCAFEPMAKWFLPRRSGGGGLCNRCIAAVEACDLSRSRGWNALPGIFKLDVVGWPAE